MPDDPRSRFLLTVVTAFLVAAGVALAIGLSEDESTVAPPTAKAPDATTAPPPADEPPGEDAKPTPEPDGPDEAGGESFEGPSGPRPTTVDERASAAAVREYVRALSARDGDRVCASFTPGALDRVEFPREHGSCPATVESSLGYTDPRGLPVWRDSETAGPISARVEGDDARVTVTVTTVYADEREPSIEDDVVYLERADERWLLVQPSITLYRAIGIAEVPPSALAPPD